MQKFAEMRVRGSAPISYGMRQVPSYDTRQVFQLGESMPVIPIHISCECPGGEARRAILKARAANVPQSV